MKIIFVIICIFIIYFIYTNIIFENFTNHNNISIISCYFCNSFSYVHPAPSDFTSYFFTNYSGMKNEIEKKGWIYCECNDMVSEDILVSSVQSKKIKFLQFKSEYPKLFDNRDILYIDHKIYIKNEHVYYMKKLSEENPLIEIILCKHNQTNKKTITDEIIDASNYSERYRRHMPETIEFINKYLQENNLKNDTIIYLTGILYYHNVSNTAKLLYDINKLCNDFQQPECQVFFAALAQKYKKYIMPINLSDINPSLQQAES